MDTKPHVRIVGIDDAPFSFSEPEVLVMGAVVRLPDYLEGVLSTAIEVDGDDATARLVAMINGSRFKEQLELVMLDGIALGGFNIVDIRTVHGQTGIPTCTITRDEPDMDSIRAALRAKFEDWERRWRLMKRNELVKVETEHKPLWVSHVGMEASELRTLIRKSTVRGALPEPIRVAHLIAAAMKTGESHGGA